MIRHAPSSRSTPSDSLRLARSDKSSGGPDTGHPRSVDATGGPLHVGQVGAGDWRKTWKNRLLALRREAHLFVCALDAFLTVFNPAGQLTSSSFYGGTRSERGNRWCERIWTVLATCNQQGRSVFAYLEAAVSAWFQGDEAPSLLPQES